jgi:spermidine synthase
MFGRPGFATEFLYIGIASAAMQLLLIRRLVGLLGGTEILYAVFVAIWLTVTGLWSFSAEIVCRRLNIPKYAVAICYAGFLVTVPVYYYLPWVRFSLLESHGTLPLSTCFVFAVFALVIPSLFPGAAFATLLHRKLMNGIGTISRAYFYDILGFATGGLLLTAVFAHTDLDLNLLIIVCGAGILIYVLRYMRGSTRLITALILITAIAYFVIGSASTLAKALLTDDAEQCEAVSMSADRNETTYDTTVMSPFGLVEAVHKDHQTDYFFNSHLIASSIDRESQELIVLPIAMSLRRERVCIIGNSVDGKAAFALLNPRVSVTLVEPDPVLACLARNESAETLAAGEMRRLQIVNDDPRHFLRNFEGNFDVIFLDYLDPMDAAGASLFTQEFFELASTRLRPGGVYSFAARCGENYVHPDRIRYLSNLLMTLKSVYPSSVLLPGREAIFVGGFDDSRLTVNPDSIISAAIPYSDHLLYLSESMIHDRLSDFRIQKMNEFMKETSGKVLTASKPSHVIVNSLLEMDKHAGFDSDLLRMLAGMNWFTLSVICLFPILVFLAVTIVRKESSNSLLNVFTVGWYGITAEVGLLVTYQTVVGNLYSRLGLLVGAFMIGTAVGTHVGRRLVRFKGRSGIYAASVLFAGSVVALAIAAFVLRVVGDIDSVVTVPLFLALNIIAGITPGAVFAISSEAMVGKTRISAGVLYGTDLLGSALAGILTSVVVIPILGLQAVFLIAGVSSAIVAVNSLVRS